MGEEIGLRMGERRSYSGGEMERCSIEYPRDLCECMMSEGYRGFFGMMYGGYVGYEVSSVCLKTLEVMPHRDVCDRICGV